MKKSEMFGISLETDNRTEEEILQQQSTKRTGLLSALDWGPNPPKAPMDTDHQEEMEVLKPKVRLNPNFDK